MPTLRTCHANRIPSWYVVAIYEAFAILRFCGLLGGTSMRNQLHGRLSSQNIGIGSRTVILAEFQRVLVQAHPNSSLDSFHSFIHTVDDGDHYKVPSLSEDAYQ